MSGRLHRRTTQEVFFSPKHQSPTKMRCITGTRPRFPFQAVSCLTFCPPTLCYDVRFLTDLQAYAEVKKRNVEIGKLTAALNEVKSTVVTAKAVAAAANRNPILSGTELSLQSGASVATSPVPSGGKSDIDSNSATNGRSRYAMDDAEGGVGQGEGVGQEQETEGGRRESGGFFGWLTGSARKKRRREE